MKKKVLGIWFLVAITTATMFCVGTLGLAFGECGSPMPTCQPAVKAVIHNAELTKFINYFGLTWMQAPPNPPALCHPPCDSITMPLAKPANNTKTAPAPAPKK